MANIVRWEPFREMTSLRDMMDRMFEEGFWRPPMPFSWAEGNLSVDVYETGDNVVVKTAIPGVKVEDIQVSVTGDTLTIRGERTLPEAGANASYHRRERDSGQFRRSFTLPKPIDNTKVVAGCINGVLELRLPYAEEAKRRKITVKAM